MSHIPEFRSRRPGRVRITGICLALATALSLNAQKQKVIFDCDLGGDIDDAFAVALLLCSQEELDVLGITAGHGNTPGRAQLACKMLYETGMDHIPVYAGDHTPTVVGTDTLPEGPSTQMIWSRGFNQLLPQKEHAADFIVRSLNRDPGEIILITVGPVDNIAAALDRDPDILKKAKQVVSMFGSVESGYGGGNPSAEWNVRGNVEAGKRLMQSGANLTLAPLDVTDHVILPEKYLHAAAMRGTPLTDALGSLYALWYMHAEWARWPKMFDGVALGMVLWPELFTTRQAHIVVDADGYTREEPGKEPNCSVGVSIDDEEFLRRMHLRIMQQDFQRRKSPSPVRIVMMGNSITYQGPWKEVLDREDVLNAGMPGWTTQQLSWIIKDHIVPNRPLLCFFAAGINDYTLGIGTDRIIKNICENLDSIRAVGTHPVFQTTLYQRGNPSVNRQIDILNREVIAFCRNRGYDYVDLRPVLCEDGDIRQEYVLEDNTHLTPGAYPVWADAIRPVLVKYGLRNDISGHTN